MTRQNLETELLQDWNQIISDLTPEERRMLAKSTPADWFAAIAELVRDPQFWQGLGVAFLEGIAKGLEDFNADR